jgi:hypothetical protein
MDYANMVIESMDSDTETRRLSPVAITSDGYIDLLNGPQDHGWCQGYTCQLRISTFWAMVGLGKMVCVQVLKYFSHSVEMISMENILTLSVGDPGDAGCEVRLSTLCS